MRNYKLTTLFDPGEHIGLHGDKLVIRFDGSHCLKSMLDDFTVTKITIRHNKQSTLLAMIIPWLSKTFKLARDGNRFEYVLDYAQILPHAPETILKITAWIKTQSQYDMKRLLFEWGMPQGVDKITADLCTPNLMMNVIGITNGRCLRIHTAVT